MRTDEAPARLRELLRDCGVNLENPSNADVEKTWAVMRRFAAEPAADAIAAEEDGDGILAQYGTFAWDGPANFELDMTRQFCFADEDGQYSHMTQLACTFQFPVNDDTKSLGERNLWSFGFELDEFFEQALAMLGFRGVREKGLEPLQLVIEYGEV